MAGAVLAGLHQESSSRLEAATLHAALHESLQCPLPLAATSCCWAAASLLNKLAAGVPSCQQQCCTGRSGSWETALHVVLNQIAYTTCLRWLQLEPDTQTPLASELSAVLHPDVLPTCRAAAAGAGSYSCGALPGSGLLQHQSAQAAAGLAGPGVHSTQPGAEGQPSPGAAATVPAPG